MKEYVNILKKCILFKNIDESCILDELSKINYHKKLYKTGEVIAIEDDNCTSIGIVLEGSVEVQKIYPSGKTITIEKLDQGSIFGEVIIFSNHHTYPATVVPSEKTHILFISKEGILNLCSINKTFLNNFMTLLSTKILVLNKKLKSMSYKSIRQKIANFILEEYKSTGKTKIQMDCSKRELAERLGIPRPSLSRELIHMKEEGILDFIKSTIIVKNINALEDTFWE